MTISDRHKHIEVVERELLFLYELLEADLQWEKRLELSGRLIEMYSHLRHQQYMLGLEKRRLKQE